MGSHDQLVEDLRKMLGNDKFCDLVFLCGDDLEAVPASRMLVAARSPVLESMLLTANMAESKLTRIPLPEMEAPIMHICLEYFYTGDVQLSSYHGALSTSMKLISAARFFLVPKLEELAIQHGRELMKKCQKLDAAKEFTYGVSLQCNCANTYLEQLLVDLMHLWFDTWDFESHKYLSNGAVSYIVQHMCYAHDYCDSDLPEFNVSVEYDSFYHVVMWCSMQIVLHSHDPANDQNVALATITHFIPRDKKHICENFLSASASDEIRVNASTLRFLKLLAEKLLIWLEKFSIDLSKIPLIILYKIIEPLDIIPCSMLLAAYRCQAAQALTIKTVHWDNSANNRNYVVSKHDTLITCKSKDLQGFARCNVAVDFSKLVNFDLEVVMLVPCEKFHIGFYETTSYKGAESHNSCVIGEFGESRALGSDGFLHSNMDGDVETQAYCEPLHIQKGLRVGMHLNPLGCSFSINGKNAGVAWTWGYGYCCEHDKVYPALSMQEPGQARIKIAFEDRMMNPRKVLLDTNDGRNMELE